MNTTSTPKPSITFSALIWLGMAIAVAGVIMTALSIGGAIAFSAKVGGIELKSTSTGLAVLAIGVLTAGLVATRLPNGVSVFSVEQPTLFERLADRAGWILVLAAILVLVCIVSVMKG